LADRDPEEARKLLDPVLERMMEAVHRYEGTVNQVMGDGIMALFGAPLAHEDHAVRACYTALRMQESVGRYGDQIQRTHGIPVQIRVGLNSGEVVVRSIGNDLHMDYTAVGQTTHLAARMEQMAKPGSILLTADALRLAEGFVQVKPLSAVAVKGLEAPIDVYEIIGVGPVRRRLEAAVARGLTRFVGRDAELDQLRKALERAAQGHGQVVGVVGEPGVGKSRLFYEFTHSHRTHGWLVLESGSVSYGKATTYLPVIDLLKAYFQIETRDDARKIREKVTGKLLTLDRALEPMLPAFLSLLDVPVEDPHWQDLDPPQRRQRTLDAVKRLLLRESQVQPLGLVFEDLHWIDSETQAVLDSVVESLPAAPILLLVNYRPDCQHNWGGKSYYTQLRLDPLPPESAGELLRALLGDDATLGPLKQLLIVRTDGNPFFLEESVRTLVETRALVGEPGAYRLAKPVHAIRVPPTVQAVLSARIDRLPPEGKSLLQTVAVIGKDIPYALLRDIADMPEDELRRGLGHLQVAEFLYEANLFPELEYTFKHSLTYQVAYQSLLRDRRRALHARIADAIERLYSAHLADQVDRLAHHAMAGEVWSKALPYCRQAGAKAFARSVPRAAVGWFEQALEALKYLPESRETLEQAVDLRLDLRYSLIPLGEFGRIFDELCAAERLARDLGDRRRLGAVSAFLSNYFTIMSDLNRGVEYGHGALAIADALGEVSLRVLANSALAMAYCRLGTYQRAIDHARANVMALQGNLLRERFGMAPIASVYSRTVLAWSLAEVGEFAEGAAIGEEGVRIAEAANHPHSIIFACQGVGVLCLRRGDFEHAISALERALALCDVADVPLLSSIIVAPLASAYAASGRVTQSLALLEQGVRRAVTLGDPFGHWLRTGGLSEAFLFAGRVEEAIPLARRAVEITRYIDARGSEAWALSLLGEVTSRQDPPNAEEAQACYRQARARAEELGMRPLLAHCHLGLGKLYRRTGDRPKAQHHLTTATTMLHKMDMRFWLEQAEAEIMQLG
ncbi:MAG: AAA family ATPase, partial [Candidatus Methylomirabilia bacterium]